MGAQLDNSQNRRVLSEINITPFVDVMLVLLVIFMVTAPMLQQGLDIELPETKPSGITVPEDPFIVVIKKNRKILVGSAELAIDDLGNKLKAILKSRKDKHIYIQADRSVPYGTVAGALADMRQAGLYKVSLITTLKEQ